MAASFVKKSDNQFYLRLTGNTSIVNFAAASESSNTYAFYIARPAGDGGTITISKPNSDNGIGVCATSNANPSPGGSIDNSRFPGCLVDYNFSGSGLREYQVTGNNQNGTPYNYNASAGGLMCLGGASLNWGADLYAYPGSGYVSNPVALGIKNAGAWKNSYNIYTKYNNAWKECLTGWIKVAGTWQKFYQNYGNSSWINMLEFSDDAIDFAIQVIEVIEVNEFVIYITQTTTNVNLQSLFEATYPGSWATNVPKRLIIDSGAVIGATDTAYYALNIPGAFSGSVKVDNNGSIQGAGGVGSGVQGGNAIFAGAAGITINNLGTIYAGGGSGGTGGTGGTGYYKLGIQYSGIRGVDPIGAGGPFPEIALQGCTAACKSTFGSNYYADTPCGYVLIGRDLCYPVCKFDISIVGDSSSYQSYLDCIYDGVCYDAITSSESWTCTTDVYSAGGAGGNGGPGQGYNQSAAGGSGGFDGGTNAGGSGTGGTGGAFGASGGNGFVGANGTAGTAPVLGAAGGPGYGGLAGYYIVNNGNVTWTATGTRLGGVA